MLESLALLLMAAALLGITLSLFRVSPSPAYLLAGLLLSLLGVSSGELSLFAEFGVIMLLFIVGVELDLPSLLRSSYGILAIALVQMGGAFLATYFLSGWLGFSGTPRLALSLAFMFSSTALVLKTLFDRGLMDSAPGQVAVGVLIMQDIAAAIAISLFSSASFSLAGLLALLALLTAGKWLFNFISTRDTSSLEILFVLAVSLAIASSSLASRIGLSAGMGALLAGFFLSFVETKHELESLFRPLKDFFLLLFFLYIGSFVRFDSISQLALLSVPLLITPLLVFLASLAVRYPPRVALVSAFALSNLSEFSLVLAWTASSSGLVPDSLVSVVALNVLLSMLLSPFLLQLSLRFSPVRRYDPDASGDFLLFGAHTTGGHILKELSRKDILVVDAKPSSVRKLKSRGVNAILGDVGDVGFLESIGAENARIIISTVPDRYSNLALLEYLRSKKSEAIVVLISQKEEDIAGFRAYGADLVVVPKKLAGRHISQFLKGLRL